MKRDYYSDSITAFIAASPTDILGILVTNSGFAIELTEREAWREEIKILKGVLANVQGQIYLEYTIPRMGRYSPTQTIIEAAMALYNNHSVTEISRSDAAAINLTVTSEAVLSIIESARTNSFKAICFVTGVPGAGKTLVGLNIATQRREETDDLYSVFLSGNGPLVDILREALARDRVSDDKEH